MSSLFFRRSISESSESILTRSPSLASIREQNSTDSWSTHENDDDRNERVLSKIGELKNLLIHENGNV